jgi:ankyrin repeat protein
MESPKLISTNTNNDNPTHILNKIYDLLVKDSLEAKRTLTEPYVFNELRDKNGNSSLHICIMESTNANNIETYIEAFKELIKSKVDILSVNNYSQNILHIAIHTANESMINLVLENVSTQPMFSINAKDIFGRSVLHYAIKNADYNTFIKLIDGNADLNCKDTANNNLLHYSIKSFNKDRDYEQQTAIFDYLLANSNEINSTNDHGQTILHLAAIQANSYITKQICSLTNIKPINVDLKDITGNTALHYAVVNQDSNIVEELFKLNASVDIQDEYTYKPLYYAVKHNAIEIAQLIIQKTTNYKSDIELFHLAAYNKAFNMLILLGKNITTTENKRNFYQNQYKIKFIINITKNNIYQNENKFATIQDTQKTYRNNLKSESCSLQTILKQWVNTIVSEKDELVNLYSDDQEFTTTLDRISNCYELIKNKIESLQDVFLNPDNNSWPDVDEYNNTEKQLNLSKTFLLRSGANNITLSEKNIIKEKLSTKSQQIYFSSSISYRPFRDYKQHTFIYQDYKLPFSKKNKKVTEKIDNLSNLPIERTDSFHNLILNDNLSKLKELIEDEDGQIINDVLIDTDINGRTLAHFCAIASKSKILCYLINSGFDPFKTDNNDRSTLFYIITNSLIDALNLVRQANLAINFENLSDAFSSTDAKYGNTFLQNLLISGETELLKNLLTFKKGIFVTNNYGQTLLHTATTLLKIEFCEFLLSDEFTKKTKKEFVNIRDFSSETALHIALSLKNKSLIMLFVAAGVNLKFSNKNGSYYHYAAKYKNLSFVKSMFQINKEIFTLNNLQQTPLHIACLHNHLIMVEFFLNNILPEKYSSFINFSDKYGNTALHYAAKTNNNNLVTFLLENEADYQTTNKFNETPILHAVEKDNYESAQTVIEFYKLKSPLTLAQYLNKQDSLGKTALHYAVSNKNYNLVKILLNNGAKFSIKDNSHKSPPHYAALLGNSDIINLLIEYGYDLLDLDSSDEIIQKLKTNLHIALAERKFDIAKIIINAYKSDNRLGLYEYINQQDETDNSALHYAITNGNRELVTTLLDNGAYPASKNNLGKTSLHIAAELNKSGFVELLVEACKINSKLNLHRYVNQQDIYGKSALDYVPSTENKSTKKLLINNGAVLATKVDIELRKVKDVFCSKSTIGYLIIENNLPLLKHYFNNIKDKLVGNELEINNILELAYSTSNHALTSWLAEEISAYLGFSTDITARYSAIVSKNKFTLLKCLLRDPASLLVVDNNKRSFLHHAVLSKNLQAVKITLESYYFYNSESMPDYIFQKDSIPSFLIPIRKSALDYALDLKNSELVDLLIDALFYDNSLPSCKKVLEAAIGKDNCEKIIPLILAKLNISVDEIQFYAIHISSISLLNYYVTDKKELTKIDNHNKNLLHHMASVNPLLIADDDSKLIIDVVMKKMRLYLADEYNDSVVKNFLNKQDNDGNTPLHLVLLAENKDSTFNYRDELINFLITSKADIAMENKHNKTPLHIAVEMAFTDAATKLLNLYVKDEISLDLPDSQGRTLLYYAITYLPFTEFSKNIIQTLLDNGANIDYPDNSQTTPRQLLVEKNWLDEFNIAEDMRQQSKLQ